MAVTGAGGDAGCTYADVEVGNLQESLPKSGFLTLVCHKPVTAMACIHSVFILMFNSTRYANVVVGLV